MPVFAVELAEIPALVCEKCPAISSRHWLAQLRQNVKNCVPETFEPIDAQRMEACAAAFSDQLHAHFGFRDCDAAGRPVAS